MRRLFNILLLIIIIVCIAAPYATGFLIEKRYYQTLARLNEGYKGSVVFEGRFERGYFSSHAETILVAGANDKVLLDHKIYHGPVVFKYSGWLKAINYKPQGLALAVIDTEVLGPISDKIASLYGNTKPYDISTRIEFNSDLHTDIINYPINVTMENRNVTWKGFKAKLDIPYASSDVHLTLEAPSLQYSELTDQNLTRQANINDFKVNFKKTMSQSNELVNLSIGSITAGIDDTQSIFSLTNIVLKADTTILQKIMNVVLDFNFGKLKIKGKDIGTFALEVKMHNLNYEALDQLSKVNITIPVTGLQQDVVVSSQELPRNEMKQLLNTRPIIDINLTCVVPEGSIVYSGHIEIGGPNAVNMSSDQILAAALLTKNLKISKTIVNKILLKYAQQKFDHNAKIYASLHQDPTLPNPYQVSEQERKNILANWANNVLYILKQKNIIQESDNSYTINLELKEDILIVNGKQITQQDIDEITPMLEMPMLPTPEVIPNTITSTPSDTQQDDSAAKPQTELQALEPEPQVQSQNVVAPTITVEQSQPLPPK